MFKFLKKSEKPEIKAEVKEKTNYAFKRPELSRMDKTKAWNSTFQKTCDSFFMKDTKGRKIAMDSLATTGLKEKFTCNYGLEEFFYNYYARMGFIGYQACAMLMNHWFISRACTLPVEEAIAAGYELLLADDNEKEKEANLEILKEIKKLAEKKYNIDEKIRLFGSHNRTFGVAYALPIIEGIDYSKPFNIDGVKAGSYKGIKIIDPLWILPEFNQSSLIKPSDLEFYEPTYYKLMNGDRIHKSHFVKITYAPVADILKPSYFFGGVPLTQMLAKPVYAAESIANELSQLVRSKRLLVVDADMESFIANQSEMESIIDVFTYARDNHSVVLKNPDGEINSLDISLNDLPEVMVKAYQRISAVCGVPYERMMSTNPSGSNASGEYTSRNYVQLLNTIREEQLRKLYFRHYTISLRADFGKHFEFDLQYNPIDSPTAVETAQNTAIKVNTLATCVQSGAISPDNMRDAVRTFQDLGINNITDDMPLVNDPTENPFANTLHKQGSSFNPMADPERSTLPVDPKTAQMEKVKIRGKGAQAHNEK